MKIYHLDRVLFQYLETLKMFFQNAIYHVIIYVVILTVRVYNKPFKFRDEQNSIKKGIVKQYKQ